MAVTLIQEPNLEDNNNNNFNEMQVILNGHMSSGEKNNMNSQER